MYATSFVLSSILCCAAGVFIPLKKIQPAASTIGPSLTLPHRGCYFASWARYRPDQGKYLPGNVDPSLCTIIFYAFGQITDNELNTYDWKDADNFNDLTTMKQQNPGLKVVLSVGGWTLSSQFPPVASSPDNRRKFVTSCVTKLRQWKLDGLDVDWEYPTLAQKDDYSALVTELRAAFDVEAEQFGRDRLLLTAAAGAVKTDGYDMGVLQKALDMVNVMTYDFHGSGWEPSQTGHNSPLYPSSSDPLQLSISGSLQKWTGLGMPKEKLNVGVAFYGRCWTLSDPDNHGPGAPANGPCPAGPYTREAGILGFNEICPMIKSGQLQKVFDDEMQSPYAFGGSIWVGYDDEQSIALKAKWILENGYAGGFIWELSNDDFTGSCSGTPNDLLQILKDGLHSRNRLHSYEFSEQNNEYLQAVSNRKRDHYGCSRSFCKAQGVGPFSLGTCVPHFCQCGRWHHAQLRSCTAGEVFDYTTRGCMNRSSTGQCSPTSQNIFDLD